MIGFMQHLQIKQKLIIIIMSTVIFSLLMVGSVLIFVERYNSKQSMTKKLMTMSKIIADRSTAALIFEDKQVAGEVLTALDFESSVVLSCIYKVNKELFSTRSKMNNLTCPKKIKKNSYQFLANYFELYHSVVLDSEIIGTVYIRASLNEIDEQLINFVALMIFIILIAGLAAYFLAKKQQQIISKPILELAKVARQISIEADYTMRLPAGGEDEIGVLNRAFNNMLEQIHRRQEARDKAVDALSEREQDLEVTLNSIGDAVIVTDVSGKVTRMNPVAEKLTGWSLEDALQQPLKIIFPILDASTGETINNPVDKVIESGETVFLSNHTTLVSKDGTEKQIADSAAPIRNGKNDILGMILVFNDVTEQYKLREAAAKSKRDLQAIMDNSPAAIHVEDTVGKLMFINQQFCQLLSVQVTQVIGKTLHELFNADVANEMQGHNQRVISENKAIETVDYVRREGVTHIYSSIKFPLLDEENKIYAVCSISTDITERKNQEEQLRRSQKMDALGKLTGGIAHDYNNLLGIIIGYAELLNEKLLAEPKLAKYAADIEHAAERGTMLTRKLLAFTRDKSSDEHSLSINELLLEQRLMLEKTLTARIELELDLADDLWSIWIDGGDLEDAIINMGINASHAISGNGRITLRTQNESFSESDAKLMKIVAGDYVLLNITDTGSGMDKATRDKVFDPFFTTKGEFGTGLGLSQVYGFVKRSGGDIKIYSEPGEGTSITLSFPRSKKSELYKASEIKIQKEDLIGTESILVVDDERSLVQLAKEILSEQGYLVFTAESGEQALGLLEREKIDMIVSDVIMPNMDGYQLADQVQKKYPHIKIQMVSGFTDDRHNRMSDNALHLNLLYKPYSSIDLLMCVRKLFDNGIDELSSENILDNKVLPEAKVKILEDTTKMEKNTARKILIMDDEQGIRELLALNLDMLGYETVQASSSDDAITLYAASLNTEKPIDVLILDLHMPNDLGGEAVAKKMRKLNANVKIIVCSGNSASPEVVKYQEHGFDGVLDKIFNREKIKQLFDSVL